MYEHFKEFYKDVLPEFSSCGSVVQFKVNQNGARVAFFKESNQDAFSKYE